MIYSIYVLKLVFSFSSNIQKIFVACYNKCIEKNFSTLHELSLTHFQTAADLLDRSQNPRLSIQSQLHYFTMMAGEQPQRDIFFLPVLVRIVRRKIKGHYTSGSHQACRQEKSRNSSDFGAVEGRSGSILIYIRNLSHFHTKGEMRKDGEVFSALAGPTMKLVLRRGLMGPHI